MRLTSQSFGRTADGQDVQVHVLSDDRGTTVRLMDYGASLISLRTPDRDGRSDEITLGYGTLASYEADTAFMGRTVGRYANRIAGASFQLDGTTYDLAANANLINHLHGGPDGLHRQVWTPVRFDGDDEVGVVFNYRSPDGEAGYPGNLDLTVTYTLSKDLELRIFEAVTTDRPTIVNLTNHTYFNLGGSTIRDHVVTVDADHYIPVSSNGIPIAGPIEVTYEMDLRGEVVLGDRLDANNDHIQRAGGYDHTFVLNRSTDPYHYPVMVKAPKTGRWLAMQTDKPGVQFYTGNNLPDRFERHAALCLEAQYFPDSPNRDDFPSVLVTPEQPYGHVTTYSFGAT